MTTNAYLGSPVALVSTQLATYLGPDGIHDALATFRWADADPEAVHGGLTVGEDTVRPVFRRDSLADVVDGPVFDGDIELSLHGDGIDALLTVKWLQRPGRAFQLRYAPMSSYLHRIEDAINPHSTLVDRRLGVGRS